MKLHRALLLNTELLGCLGVVVDVCALDQLCRGFQAELPRTVDMAALRRSLAELVGQTLDKRELVRLCWRVVGNLPELVEGRGLPIWRGRPLREEWVPLEILDGQRWAVKTKRSFFIGTQFRIRALAGSPCPDVFEVFWSNRAVAAVASRLGFTLKDPIKVYAYTHPMQLVGCRFYALFTPRAKEYSPFTEICPAKQHTAIWDWNRALIAARAPERRKCPKNYATSRPCFRCHLGVNDCPLATHALTYTQRFCERCNKQAWFNPAHVSMICMDCQYQGLFPEKKNVETTTRV